MNRDNFFLSKFIIFNITFIYSLLVKSDMIATTTLNNTIVFLPNIVIVRRLIHTLS